MLGPAALMRSTCAITNPRLGNQGPANQLAAERQNGNNSNSTRNIAPTASRPACSGPAADRFERPEVGQWKRFSLLRKPFPAHLERFPVHSERFRTRPERFPTRREWFRTTIIHAQKEHFSQQNPANSGLCCSCEPPVGPILPQNSNQIPRQSKIHVVTSNSPQRSSDSEQTPSGSNRSLW